MEIRTFEIKGKYPGNQEVLINGEKQTRVKSVDYHVEAHKRPRLVIEYILKETENIKIEHDVPEPASYLVKRPKIEEFKLQAIKQGYPPLTKGGAAYSYLIQHKDTEEIITVLNFQSKPTSEGFDGVTNELLIDILIDRLESFQSGPFPCEANAAAMQKLIEARDILIARHLERKERGVFNKYEK